MKAYVGSFRVAADDGVQSITGIVDATGTSFTPDYIVLVNGSSELEVLYSNGSTPDVNCVTTCTNWIGTSDASNAYTAAGDAPQFDAKICSGGGGTGVDAAFDSLRPRAQFGGDNYRTSSLDAVYDGGFDLNITTGTPDLDTDVIFLAFAATDGDLTVGPFVSTTGTVSVANPKGLFNPKVVEPSDSGSLSTSAGGAGGWGWGWDSPNGGPMAAHMLIGNQTGGDYRYQRTTEYDNTISAGSPPSANAGCAVTEWTDSSITVGGGISRGFVFGGEAIYTTSGTFTQPTEPGFQTIDLGLIDASMVVLASNGAEASTSVRSDWAELCVSFLDGTRQASYWAGEHCDGTLPLKGAGFLSGVSALRFASAGPDGPSTAFTAVAEFISLTSSGSLTLNWTSTDSVSRQIMWFAVGIPGTEPPPPTPPTQTTFPIRWQRRSPTVFHDGKRLFHRRFQVDFAPGVGLPASTDSQDPIVMVRTSDDGGFTWSSVREMTLGRQGNYLKQMRLFQLGAAYNRVYEITGSDPVNLCIVQAWLDVDEGAH